MVPTCLASRQAGATGRGQRPDPPPFASRPRRCHLTRTRDHRSSRAWLDAGRPPLDDHGL